MFTKFLGVGAIATLIQYLILVLLVEGLSIRPYIASTFGYVVSAIFNYVANYYFSFGSKANHISAVSKFLIVVFLGLQVNAAIVFFSTEKMHLHYILSQIFATGIVTIVNYFLLKYWAYK
jgi:putative flippase GtrA